MFINVFKIIFNTIISAQRAKFLDLECIVCISKFLAFLGYIFSLARARDKIKSKKARTIDARTLSIKRKILSKKFITL